MTLKEYLEGYKEGEILSIDFLYKFQEWIHPTKPKILVVQNSITKLTWIYKLEATGESN